MKTKINIDLLRFIMSLFVVAIHISPFMKINYSLDLFITRILGRIAVPLFLCITGYFILPKALKNKKELINYTLKILKLYFICTLLYLPINIYAGRFKNINLSLIIKDLFINGTFYHLWYFPSLIIGLWITFYLIKKINTKSIWVIILLYTIGLLGDSYYGLTIKCSALVPIYKFLFNFFDYTRNGFFFVPIFIYIGYLLKVKNDNKKDFLKMLFSFLFMSIEAFILHYFNIPKHDSMYIFLPIFMFFLFKNIIKKSSNNRNLRNMATYIYILHPLVIVIVRFASSFVHLEKILVNNNLCLFMIVSLLSILCSSFLLKVKEVNYGKNIK